MQGRLSPADPAGPQVFPRARWRDEFEYAATIGFDAIEWLIDLGSLDDNPIRTPAGRAAIRAAQRDTGISVPSVCAHYLMQRPPFDRGTSHVHAALLDEIVECTAEIGVNRIVIPLMDGASIARPEARELAEALFDETLERAVQCGTVFALETDIAPEVLGAFLDRLGMSAAKVCFDTGNLTALGYDIVAAGALLLPHVAEIHIKDRRIGGPSVPLGEGDTPFASFAAMLAESGWNGPLVLETPVSDDWHSEARRNLQFVRGAFRSDPEQR